MQRMRNHSVGSGYRRFQQVPLRRSHFSYRSRRLAFSVMETDRIRASFESEVEFTFDAQNGETLLRIVQTFLIAELRDRHQIGLPNALDRLERVIHAHISGSTPSG